MKDAFVTLTAQHKETVQRVVSAFRKKSVSSQHATTLMRWMSEAVRGLGPEVGKHVYVVGGAVRNFVIDQPIKDVDMVIDSQLLGKDSAWLAQRLERKIPAQTELITDNYGVAKIVVKSPWVVDGVDLSEFSAEGDAAIEIVNARSETYSDDSGGGYKPSVERSGIKEDIMRRDFTFNTLMWRLSDLANGPDKAEIIDMTGCGLEDLKAGEARCPLDPDSTFQDDPTRMLRAIKFLVKYGLKIPPDTAASIRRKRMALLKVSPSRVAQELFKLLEENTWKQTLAQLDHLGLIEPLKVMLQKDKMFAATMKGRAAKLPVQFFFKLTDLGLPVRHDLGFLDAAGRKRVSDIAFEMTRDEQDRLVSALKNPGNAIKDKSFMPMLAKEKGIEKKDLKSFFPRVQELSRIVLLGNPDLLDSPNKLKDEIRRSVDKMRVATLLPIMSPWFNLREVIKQCVLLEDHLFHPGKRCPDCIAKHFLTIEGFLEEAVTLDKIGEVWETTQTDLTQMTDRIRLLQRAWLDDSDPQWIAQALRSIRKELDPTSLLGVYRQATIESVVDRSYSCPHKETQKMGGLKRWIMNLLSRATTVKAVHDWGVADVTKDSKDIGGMIPQGFVWQIGKEWYAALGGSNTPKRFRNEYAAISAVRYHKIATKSLAEKEDEEADRLVRPSPKKKPPRKDLRKERMDAEGSDVEDLGAEGDDDLSMNYKRIAQRWLTADGIEELESDEGFKATKGDKTEHFSTREEAEAWLNEDPGEEEEGGGEDGDLSSGPEVAKIDSEESIPEGLKGLLDLEAFDDPETDFPRPEVSVSGPVDGKYTITVDHVDGSKDEVSLDPATEEGLDLLQTFPEQVIETQRVKNKQHMEEELASREELTSRLEALLPDLVEALEENAILSEAFDFGAFEVAFEAETEGLKQNPMKLIDARAALSGEYAAERFFEDGGSPAAFIGEALARAEYAKATYFNPAKDLSDPKDKSELTKDARFAQVSSTIEDSRKYSGDDRQVLVMALEAETDTLPERSKRAAEIEARIEGHHLAAILKGHNSPGGAAPSKEAKHFVRKMAETEDGHAALCTPLQEWHTQESREVFFAVMEEASDDQFQDFFDADTPAGIMAGRVSLGYDPDERGILREWSGTMLLDSIAVYAPLLAGVGADAADSTYLETCQALIKEAHALLLEEEDPPDDLFETLRKGVSGAALSIFNGGDEKKQSREGFSDDLFLLADKVREHADTGKAEALAQKTLPPPPRPFGGRQNENK